MNHTRVSRKGFTLIELLVVIGIIAILAAIVAIAINPTRQYGQARDAQRWSDINALLNSVHQYSAENAGSFPPGIPAAPTVIGDGAGQYDICAYIVPTYLPALPTDPGDTGTYTFTSCAANYNTGYRISLSGGRVTISATPEQAASITLTR